MTSLTAAEMTPSIYGESTYPSHLDDTDSFIGGFEQRYPPPSPDYQVAGFPDVHERLDDLARTPTTPRTVSPSHYAPSGWSTPRPSKASSARSSRQGSYPVPELTAEERAQRRAMRKTGHSPEYHLPPQLTKAELRRRAWQERQTFEAERDRLLQLLPFNDGEDPAADPLDRLSIKDVPILNQLSDLHFGTSIRATRDAGLYYLQLSLRLDKRQPDRAHMLALLLEAQDPEGALYWRQIAVRHAPDDPDYLSHLGNAYRSIGNVDSAAHAFGELTLRFRDTPFEALGWYKLARLFEDGKTPEERADAHAAFVTAYECLERLAQVPLVERRAGPWEILGQVEDATLFGLGLFGEPVQHLPRLFATGARISAAGSGLAPSPPLSPISLHFSPHSTGVRAPPGPESASEALPKRSSWSPPATAFPSPPPDNAIPTAPSSVSRGPGTAAPHRLGARQPDSSIEQISRRASSLARSAQPPGRRQKVDPVVSRTLDTVVKGLHAMSRSQNVDSLTASTHELADQVETAFQRMYEAQTQEAQHHEELFRVLEQVHRELTMLPDRVAASAKLSASRPPGVEPLVPYLNPVDRALRRVEQARLLSV